MTKIEMGKTYKTREGLAVRVLCVDKVGERPVVALVPRMCDDELPMTYYADGKFLNKGENTSYDLVEVGTWDNVAVDAKIFVRTSISEWMPRHFAQVEGGKVYAWVDGSTSHSVEDNGMQRWAEARLA